MVLQPKLRKSRSSPGFVAGVTGKPIHIVETAAVEAYLAAAFLFSTEHDPARMKRAGSPAQFSWRGVEQPGSSSGS